MKNLILTVTPDTTDEVFDGICKGFNQKYGCELSVTRVNDEKIIGGFIADIEGEVFDTSVKTRLDTLAQHIGRAAFQ